MPAVRTGERACAQPGCRALEHSTPCTHLLEASALPLMQLKRVQSAPLQRPSPWTHTWAVCQQQLPPVLALAQVEGPGHARPQPAACHPHPAAANTGQVGVGVGGRKQGHARVNVDLAASSCANGAAGPPVCFTLTTDHPCNWGQTMCTALTGLPINSQPAWPGNQTSHACGKRSEADVSSSHCRRCCSGGPCSGGPSSVLQAWMATPGRQEQNGAWEQWRSTSAGNDEAARGHSLDAAESHSSAQCDTLGHTTPDHITAHFLRLGARTRSRAGHRSMA